MYEYLLQSSESLGVLGWPRGPFHYISIAPVYSMANVKYDISRMQITLFDTFSWRWTKISFTICDLQTCPLRLFRYPRSASSKPKCFHEAEILSQTKLTHKSLCKMVWPPVANYPIWLSLQSWINSAQFERHYDLISSRWPEISNLVYLFQKRYW